ncbi:UDP-N-acetylmuramoyl-tripeptide--D-alanyl-D-alanine ligase subfamily [Synechococcus sp. PCC 7335]|uniref:UDP-N-acetylmuramoyl-tripeptide--D-alanyl-D- alanine ligase n=1 Tax=Synechococcus sp. (strain ATCC 29403 / PCC 7335) TaxID=91464 RepID=UPI00017ED5D5|nr:UDP-N-acetylmuramoyl-tripeptide--D-alanyl-D-alanine ligase [Synechococcus sp. PCC 7335]EDX87268.1 UDP-N-acetylmuramoyl-tripeptide--D-alanyl-D-alanine ligase subfamily [Synechococcus sp. PCC 7335]
MGGFSASLGEIAKVLGVAPQACVEIETQAMATGVTTDTRTVQAGELFVALVGETFDGHEFAKQAVEKGAIATIVKKGVFSKTVTLPRIEVTDTLAAYQTLGQWWRSQCAIPVVAITGSVGKTTTKELVAAALSQFGTVFKTRANYNNEIGVPKTLLGLTTEHDYAVVEMGMRGLEEIALLTQIAKPTVALITNVGTAHIGRLGSRAAIAQAKCELLRELPTDGTAVLNHDDARLMSTAARFWSGTQITYGLEGGDVRGQIAGSDIIVDGVKIPLPLPGRHNALNLLSAIATLKALNLNWQQLSQGFSVPMPAGRSQRHQLPNDILLLDETYNAGAEATIAALELLADQPGTRHIAVLGTMKELGTQSVDLHRLVGKTVADLALDQLLILADPIEAKAMADSARSVPSQQFDNHDQLAQCLKAQLQAGDRLLFKASRSVEMDKVVDQLLKDFMVDT